MPLGVPVVPEENITTRGVLKATCSNFSSGVGELREMKVSRETLIAIRIALAKFDRMSMLTIRF